jgi:hypothetical protein
MRRRIHVYQETAELDVRYALCHMRRRIHVYQKTAELDVRYALCHMRRRIHVCPMSYEEEDTCIPGNGRT